MSQWMLIMALPLHNFSVVIDHRRGRGIGNACSMCVTLYIDLYILGFGQYGSSHSV